jgi:hypothetical protein
LRVSAVGVLLAGALAGGALAQNAPSEVTDAEIERYKASAQTICLQAGMARGDPQVKVAGFCNCMLNTLNKTLKRPEWQQAYFYSQKNQLQEEQAVFAPYMSMLQVCRQD